MGLFLVSLNDPHTAKGSLRIHAIMPTVFFFFLKWLDQLGLIEPRQPTGYWRGLTATHAEMAAAFDNFTWQLCRVSALQSHWSVLPTSSRKHFQPVSRSLSIVQAISLLLLLTKVEKELWTSCPRTRWWRWPGSDFSTAGAKEIFTFAAVSAVLLDLNDTQCFSLWRKKMFWLNSGKALVKRCCSLWPTVKGSQVGPMALHPTSRKPW